jgi:hypothetical protein
MIIYSISAISHDAVAETAASLKVRARAGGWRAGGRSSSAAGWKEGRKEGSSAHFDRRRTDKLLPAAGRERKI